jgi:hypothetical protein
MAVQIITKPKTKAEPPSKHKACVPLRVVEIRKDRLRASDTEGDDYLKYIGVGDIIVILPSILRCESVFNCTKQSMLDHRYYENGAVLCLRAYDIAEIVLTNDDEPAPVS